MPKLPNRQISNGPHQSLSHKKGEPYDFVSITDP